MNFLNIIPFLIILSFGIDAKAIKNSKYQYSIKYFTTYLDHFSYINENATFSLRYLISLEYWQKGNPIFFYTGNEGDITLFAENTGFVWELAEQMKAMVVFGEHRYYGVSLPFGKNSFDNATKFGYLTAEQALADYVHLLDYLRSNISGAAKSPVIAFGGSYGGMLAAYMRQKYPNVIQGSIAASAPVLMVANDSDCSKSFRILTEAYRRKGSNQCVKNIRQIWPSLTNYYSKSADRLANLSKILHTCSPLKSIDSLLGLLPDTLFTMAMANYPYPANFLAPMPAWPITQFCKPLNVLIFTIPNPDLLMTRLAQGLQVFYNYTGHTKCLDFSSQSDNGLDVNGWSLQTCTELPMPMCMTGKEDMFFPSSFSRKSFNSQCKLQYGVTPRWTWPSLQFWADRLHSVSNVVYSNGQLDPWSAGGVPKSLINPANDVRVISISNGAHHVDLRASNPGDTGDIKAARAVETAMIHKWLRLYYSRLQMSDL